MEVEKFPCPHFKWRNIILELVPTKWHHPGLSFLLKVSRSLGTLTMYIFHDWNYLFQVLKLSFIYIPLNLTLMTKWIWEYDFDGETYWDSQEGTFPCLENITTYSHINATYVIKTVKVSAEKCSKITYIIISTKKTLDLFTSEQLLELSQKLLMFAIASSKGMIYFS